MRSRVIMTTERDVQSVVIVGMQWGDEGKGKIVDYLAQRADCVARYQGGNNAGHTIVVGDQTYKFHHIPGGILNKRATCILGNGMVIDLLGLIDELKDLENRGISTGNIYVSETAHLIFDYHRIMDGLNEGLLKVGTTKRGIGPAYEDKVRRHGIRVIDLANPKEFKRKLDLHFKSRHAIGEINWGNIYESHLTAFEKISHRLCSSSMVINRLLRQNSRVILEGAQGTFLDVDHGSYPYVTSSSPTAGGACIGVGIGPRKIDKVVGVSKAYSTRVGEGPFPTELFGDINRRIVEDGHEFGTTTGRVRRCGWLDLVMLKHAIEINGIDSIVLTKLDVLDSFDSLKICIGYEIDGDSFSVDWVPAAYASLVPQYEELPGWKTETGTIRNWNDMPDNAIKYVRYIESYLGVPVEIVSVGAERTATMEILGRDPWRLIGREN